jgi:Tfp pilus assembly protein PilX
MNKTLIGCGIFLVLGLVVALILGIFFVTTMNKETRLRNQITAKQTDNTSEYDNLWKKLSQ